MKQIYVHYDRAKARLTGEYRYCPFCRSTLAEREVGHKLRPTCPACGFVQFRNPAPTVAVLVVDGSRVLLGRRAAPPGQGLWATPSGYVEYEDDFLSTAVREVREETGLEIVVDSIPNVVASFYAPQWHFLVVYLLARVVGGELAAADDMAEVSWFLLSGPFPELAFPEDVEMLQWLGQGALPGLPVGLGYPDRRQLPAGNRR